MQRDDYCCVYCGTTSSPDQEKSRKAVLSIDHIIPVTRGGGQTVEDLATACRACNGEKNDRTPEEWGLLPTFLQVGVSYTGGKLITDSSHTKRDNSVTREEKRREELKPTTPTGVVVDSDAGDSIPGVQADGVSGKPCPHQQIIALYHEVLPMCPQIRNWTPARAVQLRARWNEDERRQNLDYWRKFFEYVKNCDFLVGKVNGQGRRPFFADLEWMVKSANFTKIREGKYAND
jgi:hypothetical protein